MSAESTDGPEPVEPPPSREAVFIPPVREWAVADLRDAEYNPREITDRQLADLQASIEDFGLVEDVVVNVHPQRRGVVVGGHQKLRILRAKGVDRVPCKEVELTQERERELNVRLNANGGQFSGKLLVDWGFDRERLEDWGMGLEDLAAFDHAASMVGAGAAANDGEADGGVNWGGMPGFDHDDLEPWAQMKVSFRSPEDREAFGKLIGQTFTDKTKSIWYPVAPYEQVSNMRFRSTDERPPRYPVYVLSKGRWDSRLTVKALEEIGIPFSLVVEPQELDRYAAVVDPAKILTLPFSNLGQGSMPARNWVWDHALAAGSERHWIVDDNIRGFWRFQNNFKYRVGTAATFRAAEDFTDRWDNVALSGMQYYMFIPRKCGSILPYTLNTRIYSCILIKNDLPFRWRGRYNEDTDLSIRALKAGWCTVLFNAFLAWKMTTMEMTGGNTDELYKGDGRMRMAESLRKQHPDVVRVTRRWGRWQHQVDYRGFKANALRPRPGLVVAAEPDDYGMWLEVDGGDQEEAMAGEGPPPEVPDAGGGEEAPSAGDPLAGSVPEAAP